MSVDLYLYICLWKSLSNELGALNTRKVFKEKHTCGLLFAKLGYTF